ncbi:hypothetical protein [Roseicyclus amphidinii]|uniref:hypothetical protein n=1 Tax=Roseicyclus amphidinii TaxID=3034232 RepID=UPI0024E1123D|nr:hypothetical protein [Roseicyclus sp. Amp-Y-6]
MIRAVARWLSRHLVGVLVALSIGAVATAVTAVTRWLDDRAAAAVHNDRLVREIDRLRAENAARAESAAVQRAHAERLAGELAARQRLIDTLTDMEGLDAPLPDPLRDAARLLWPE